VSVTGLCQVCESARAVEQCRRCGTLVCRDHFDADTGFCVDCAREARGGRSDSDADGHRL
jgi:hypothetical protein